MSRGFWAAIGTIVGFFIGGLLGVALGKARFHNVEGAGDLGAIGEIVGLVCGFAIAWDVASRRKNRS